MFSGGKFTEVSVRIAHSQGDFFQYNLPETVTTTTQWWKVTKTWGVKVFAQNHIT